jgi:starch phosphorylase
MQKSPKNEQPKNCPEQTVTTEALRKGFLRHLHYTLGASHLQQSDRERYLSFSLALRDQLIQRWIDTQDSYHLAKTRRVYYLSMEFLMGRMLDNNASNLLCRDTCREMLQEQKLCWEDMQEFERDPGLGNGGLGRLAACFLDSAATMGLPCQGYGLRYDYGLFRQKIVNGFQVEEPDFWHQDGYPWEIKRQDFATTIGFGGTVAQVDENGRKAWHWFPSEMVTGVPYDVPIIGYGGKTVNILRLWSAKGTKEFDFTTFNQGAYTEAVTNKIFAENLTKALYPNDNVAQGRELRVRQQYFFVACTLADIFRQFESENPDYFQLPQKVFIQLNETHPALVIPELMRILIDQKGLEWEAAWAITRACTAYTNHTTLPEALEKWSVALFSKLLPRHMQIIFEINSRFMHELSQRFPGDQARMQRMSIIEEGNVQKIRMANLAIIGSKYTNGVAEIHTTILKKTLFRDFVELWPEKFQNKTNGITQRRWLLQCNPALANLISTRLGKGWIRNLEELRKLEDFLDDDAFLAEFQAIKVANKKNLAKYILEQYGMKVNPNSLFDVQVKRLHEYKRQLLQVLYIIIQYRRLLKDPSLHIQPRTFIFGAKAAAGYDMAKRIIGLIHGVAKVVNNNPAVNKYLNVVFLPDYRVSLAEKIIPAADLSEQISLAGTEASGTGNMKLMLNGAITMGTLDGANVEILKEVGEENIFIFGMTAQEVAERRRNYSPWDIIHSDPEIEDAVDCIRQNMFSPLNPDVYAPIVRTLLDFGDHFMVLADLRSFIDTQERVSMLYQNPKEWYRKALLNTARSGKFSSDRTIQEYASEIWDLPPFDVDEFLASEQYQNPNA